MSGCLVFLFFFCIFLIMLLRVYLSQQLISSLDEKTVAG